MSLDNAFYNWLTNRTNTPPKVALSSAEGISVGSSAYGYLRVTDEPAPLFSEAFETLDTTNRWTTRVSTGTATVATGALTTASSTTANAYGGVFTQPTFTSSGLGFVVFGTTMKIPNSTIANTERVWGMATVPGTPTTAVPVTSGLVFALDGAGVLTAEVWKAGVRVSFTDISAYKPADNAEGRYAIVYRGDLAVFYAGSTSTPVATFSAPDLDTQALPAVFLSVAGASAPASSATLVVNQFGIGDTAKASASLSDGTNPFIRGTIKKASTAAAATDTALVVAMHPSTLAPIQGAGAHGSAIAGNPHRLGARALTADYTAVATGQTADLKATTVGALITHPYNLPELSWQYATPIASPITGTAATAMKAAAAAGIRNYVTGFTAYNNSATASIITIQDGSTVIYTDYLPANGRIQITFPVPLRGTAATAMNVVLNTTATSTFVSAQGFTAP